jgi:hypothetical protein
MTYLDLNEPLGCTFSSFMNTRLHVSLVPKAELVLTIQPASRALDSPAEESQSTAEYFPESWS